VLGSLVSKDGQRILCAYHVRHHKPCRKSRRISQAAAGNGPVGEGGYCILRIYVAQQSQQGGRGMRMFEVDGDSCSAGESGYRILRACFPQRL